MSALCARRFALLSLVAGTLGACSRDVPDGPFARARVIERLDETIGGEMSLARPGDFMLENDRFRVSILAGRNGTGPGLFGGSVVDADLQWGDASLNGGKGRDQWNEMFPLASMNVPFAANQEGLPPTVFIPTGADGADGGAAVVRVASPATPFLTLLDLLWGLVAMPDMWLVTDYIAEPGVPWLTMRTTVSFQDVADLPVDGTLVDYPAGGLDVIKLGLQEGLVLGDFWLAGGSLDVFAPGIGFDEDGAVYKADEAGLNIFSEPFEFPFVAAIGDGISYGIAAKQGSMYVPLFTSSQTAVVGGAMGATSGDGCAAGKKGRFCADDAFTYERVFFIGDGDVGSILDQVIALRDEPYAEVTGHVLEEGTGVALSGVDVFVYTPGAEFPYSQWRTDVRPDDTLPDGSFGGKLPVGDWEIMVHKLGRPDGKRIPIHVDAGDTLKLPLAAPRGGMVTFEISDETGRHVPAKLTVFREDPNTAPNRQPALGDGYIGGQPEWVVFADHGTGEIALPPGDYYAVASRGLEYEIDVSDAFTVDALRANHLTMQVERSLMTEGWVSADFHVHSAPSHDSGVTLDQRLRTMVCEGMEFFSSSDHDTITDFAPVVEDLDLSDWIQTAVGVETTTIEIGHYLAFPLQQHFLGDVGGAMDWTGMTPSEIISTLREQGQAAGYDPLVFVAHPRAGILGYFDQFGFDPFKGTPGSEAAPGTPVYDTSFGGLVPNPNALLQPGNMTLDFDAIEVFTEKRFDTHRIPTVDEVVAFNNGTEPSVIPWLERTMAEQEELKSGVIHLNAELGGSVDDWFTLLNLGYRITALGNSDTHGTSSVEAGCPRNFVVSETDDPEFIDDQAIADAVKNHQVVASYGPFVRLWVDGAPIGSSIQASGELTLAVEVQAPTWVDVDRVEIYENGTLIAELAVEPDMPPYQRLYEELTVTPDKDSWYVAIAMGDGSMAPVFSEVDIPAVPLDVAVTGALGGLGGIVGAALGDVVGYPRVYPIHPYAVTNPIWVDVDGGGWTAPGVPSWMIPQDLPEE
ncbi:MAG: hypothetical protein H6733_15745 [Alphaproteobacteria bacterium]|nr:hypothetical protein [Alphaproteobacteria bacterium]